MDGLNELLNRTIAISDAGRDEFFNVANNYFSPGFWTAYTARARARNLQFNQLEIPNGETNAYAKAICIERALGHIDTYPYRRKGVGDNYSPLVLLESREQTDIAAGEINSCIRGLFGEPEYAEFVSTICELVGDLLDNVWAHGKATGFSMAQKWNNPPDFNFEFAVADYGIGFLRELQRVGTPNIHDHESAIKWCIERGNSTKKRIIDEWQQRLPPDVMGNPIGKHARVVESDNHHMGLGLAKLIDAVEKFHGRCWLASGDTLLFISPDAKYTYSKLPIEWHGVAIACRFDSSKITRLSTKHTVDEFESIMNELLRN